jgi:hypothetical protein
MDRWDQYEIWLHNGQKWEFVAAFRDFDVASAVARNKRYRMRLLHVFYDGSKKLEELVIAELGSTRQEP